MLAGLLVLMMRPKLTLTGFRVLGNIKSFYDFWYVTGNNCADMAPGLLLAGNEHCKQFAVSDYDSRNGDTHTPSLSIYM